MTFTFNMILCAKSQIWDIIGTKRLIKANDVEIKLMNVFSNTKCTCIMYIEENLQ